MTAKGILTIFFVVFMNLNDLKVIGARNSEESQPHYEYIQIFKSIPTLFEYLLNALEERPEILEKNDITMFSRNIDISDTNERDNSGNENKIDKRDADFENTERQDEDMGVNDIEKRDSNNAKSGSGTTVAYEYGNSNIVMKGLDDANSNKVISKRASNSVSKTLDNEGNVEKQILPRQNRINGRTVFNLDDGNLNEVLQHYGDAYFGSEHLFGLDLKPEEIEERILTAEKLLEEHNNKKQKEKE